MHDEGFAFNVRPEVETDRPHIRDVHSAAFGDDQVPNLVDALRSASAPTAPMSYVAVRDNRIIGHIMMSAGRLDAPRQIVNVLVLSPLGVLPEFQKRGIGTALVKNAIEAAEQRGEPLVFLEGSPRFYGLRGFERASETGFRTPSLRIPDQAFQVARLSSYELWMTGTLVYSDPFWALDCVGLRDV
ncbi:GNAT family N-acetyltransferase [Allomesorhizobium camelthorni]|uniref:N-acetyltransferase n=1 Tax=Allomesorhizobium camelthorni TaxID=475069 RepID=A0A6G4WH06_9HYPH|nr:N-acetyltransferase [Mesorhizobium camelthorni]NGO54085.1 N-acetyltransferase [Mesorhizobium camelthorni]